MEKIKVLIADDHRVVREGLAAILKTKDDIHIVGEAQDGMEAVEKVKTLVPDVDRKSTRLNSSHLKLSRMPSSA